MGGGRASGRAGGLVVLVRVWDGDSTGGGVGVVGLGAVKAGARAGSGCGRRR